MQQDLPPLPNAKPDTKAIKQACKKFVEEYNPILTKVDQHLQEMITKTEPAYAKAYMPWLKGLQDLCKGVFLMAKGIPLPDPESFLDALKMFSFDSTLQLLHDLCLLCKIKLQADWIKKFRQDIDNILFAAVNLQQQQSMAH